MAYLITSKVDCYKTGQGFGIDGYLPCFSTKNQQFRSPVSTTNPGGSICSKKYSFPIVLLVAMKITQ